MSVTHQIHQSQASRPRLSTPLIAMAAQYVPPSASKARLMAALGLEEGNPQHEHLYLTIKVGLCSQYTESELTDTNQAECAVGYDAICGNRANLRPQCSHVQDRFSYTQMRETAIDNAIVQIYQKAQPAVSAWYNRWGVDGTKDNFIIRWFLYHLFRNRDLRNDRKARSMDFHADDDEDEGPSAASSSSTSKSATSGYYDPARNNYRT